MSDEKQKQTKLAFGFNRGDYMTAEFRELWIPYPNKSNPAGAFRAFKKLGLDRLHDERKMVVGVIVERARYDKKWLEGFVPMLSTFLNDHRFLDENWPRTRHAPAAPQNGQTFDPDAERKADEASRKRREQGPSTTALRAMRDLRSMGLPTKPH